MPRNNRTPKNDTPANPSAEEVTNPAAIVSAPQESAQTGESAPTAEPVPAQDETTEDYSAGERVTPEQITTTEETTTEGTEEGTTSTEGTEEGTTTEETTTESTEETTRAQKIQAALAGRIVGGSKARSEKNPTDPGAFTRVWLAKDAKMTPEEAKAAQKKVTYQGVSMTAYKVPLIKAIREWAAAHTNPKIQEIAKATTAQMLLWIGRQYIVPNVIRSILKDMKIEESEALKTA